MSFRPKLFLTFSVLCVSPLLILSLTSFHSGLKATNELVRGDLAVELATALREFEAIKRDREDDLIALTRSRAMLLYLRAAHRHEALLKGGANQIPSTSAPAAAATTPERNTSDQPPDTRAELGAALGINRKYYAGIGVFDPTGRPMFVDEPQSSRPEGLIVLQMKDWLLNQFQPDERVWTANPDQVLCSIARHASLGEILRCSAPVFTSDKGPSASAALVADIGLDPLISEATRSWNLPVAETARSSGAPERIIIVLDPSEHIVYHTNNALRHQVVGSSMPYFKPVAIEMMSGQSGSKVFDSSSGDQWIAAYAPVKSSNVFLSVARNYSLAASLARRNGWMLIGLSILIGLAAALLLTHYSERKTQRIERVTETVAAIARGNLEQRVEAPSSDDLRPIADSVNVMSERLREQIAKEAEAHQFQSFIKLSALLTHDLKNAIEALSLTVSNMERHFDKPEFRADALKGLTSATDKLRALVARISNPVNTLSGEFKKPRPTDLVPLIRRVLAQTTDTLSGRHEIDVQLPTSLFALADAERMEKVVENLVLNAIEAMSAEPGKLTIAGGTAEGGNVFFSVTDTGAGMTREFIQQELFRPFATTKKRGVGLGLYTCREVVRTNGGSIEVHSVEGSGTTFRVVLASAKPKSFDTERGVVATS